MKIVRALRCTRGGSHGLQRATCNIRHATCHVAADAGYVMAFSIMLLNTDLHSPQIKRKMTKQEFMYNNTHIHESINLSEELLASIYDRIQVCCCHMRGNMRLAACRRTHATNNMRRATCN